MNERFSELEVAYLLKEKYIYFNETETTENASHRLVDLINEFSKNRISKYVEFYNLLINWNQEIVNSFDTVNDKRMNNCLIESRNRQVETLIYNAN